MGTVAKRDNDYYLSRMKAEAPIVYADYLAGKFRSVAAARFAAGLGKPRSRLAELKNAYEKATASEKRAFVDWLKTLPPHPAPTRKLDLMLPDGRLRPKAIELIEKLMERRGIKMGQVMAEMGLKRRDPSLGLALKDGARVRPQLKDGLVKWIQRNTSGT